VGDIRFAQIPLDDPEHGEAVRRSGRPAYKSISGDESVSPIYLYHTQNELSGVGRWVVNSNLFDPNAAMAYVNSYAATPYLMHTIHANEFNQEGSTFWKIPSTDEPGNWISDDSFYSVCSEEYFNSEEAVVKDSTIFFDSSFLQPELTGFYVARTLAKPATQVVYSLITSKLTTLGRPTYLFKLVDGDKWLIGDDYSVDAAVALVEDPSDQPYKISTPDWRFVSASENDTWVFDTGIIFSVIHTNSEGVQIHNIYDVVRFNRAIQYIPANQSYLTMRNNIPIPQIGLGTGGIYLEESKETIATAFGLGYRFLDLAREYGNEYIVPQVFAEYRNETMPVRQDVFLQTKVWPTQLGFIPTMRAIETSLAELQTSYIDAYLLHWPS
jgi:Aldo/keto reductase family